jgi:predicted outer membrane repeat protein
MSMLIVCLHRCGVSATAFLYLQSPYGGAINGQEEGGFTKVRSCRFFNNSASDKGGAIHIETRSHLLDVRDTEFDSNIVSAILWC